MAFLMLKISTAQLVNDQISGYGMLADLRLATDEL
eukprot:SAG31_NODE_796_length_12032_cov_21.073242_6_plen_35_part_00